MSSSTDRMSWIRIACLSVSISIFVQVIWPNVLTFTETQKACDISLLPLLVKRLLSCRGSGRVLSRSKEIGYFVDPFPNEPWSDENGQPVTFNEVSISAPIEHDRKYLESEALAALSAAVSSKKRGNVKRAEVIMRHALNLAPTHPDILTEYGILIETVQKNVVEAEGLYTRALSYNPHHTEALIHHARTMPVVKEIDKEMLKELHEKRNYFHRISRDNAAVRRVMRDSYFMHIYHTVAIEGNTMSLGQTRSLLETKMVVAGKSIIEHNEILGMDAALRFLNQSLVHIGHITLQDILSIHRRVLGFVNPEEAGVFRTTQVFVGKFTPTAPQAIPFEMNELVRWLNDEETLMLDPVEFAAIAHYKLVFIHPFVDGNGRTARLLMNFILMKNGFPPVIIPIESRTDYYLSLNAANGGDLRPFVRFIARHTDATLQTYISAASVCDNQQSVSDCMSHSVPKISVQTIMSESERARIDGAVVTGRQIQ
ncbi:hypothetical protein AB6A40_000306 [Gnathostoma spinigerum]|uniref:protein adenylyltransferase n=1 Tax=Gnathostoma spinigerum TaxID=75299 RepID=A0ABD6EAV5_9BILA